MVQVLYQRRENDFSNLYLQVPSLDAYLLARTVDVVGIERPEDASLSLLDIDVSGQNKRSVRYTICCPFLFSRRTSVRISRAIFR
jgi:hypothetical protein